MSGATDLARLTETIDLANELLLSPAIKMMDVGDGVERPTNAMVMTNLAIQLGGAMPYATVEQGLVGSVSGTNFSVLAPGSLEYVILYRNDSGAAVEVDRYPNALATERATEFAESAYSLTFPRSLADEMPWVIVDKDFRAILGVKSNGAVHAILDSLPGLDLVGEYAWAITDAGGVVLLGIKWTGEVVVFGQASTTVTAFADGPRGGKDIFALLDGVPYQLTSSGDNFSPVGGDGRVSYVRRNGSVLPVSVDMPIAGSVASFITQVLHIISSGQSLAMGSGSAVTTTQPPTANRLFTLKDGVRLANEDATLTADMISPFIPLVAKTQEVPAVQLSAQLNRLRGLPSNAGVVASAHGRGGYSVSQLSKGTLPYTNSIAAVTGAKLQCNTLGYTYRVPFVDWIQGENDRTSAAGAYTTAMLQLQTDYDADIRAISGQGQVVPILLDQISNWTAYNITTSFVPLEQLKVALDHPTRFYCAGPKYWVQTNPDGVHLPAAGSMRLGAMHARAAEAIIKGTSWKPTHAVSAVIVGAVITVKFHTPTGPLVVDTLAVTDPGNWGLRYVDDTASASVSSVKLIGNNTLEVTLSATPTGTNPYIGVADIGVSGAAGGPTTGPRSCLRDSSPDLDGYGQSVFNWACHQRISVTA